MLIQQEIQTIFGGNLVYPLDQYHLTIANFWVKELQVQWLSVNKAATIIEQVINHYKDQIAYEFEGFTLAPWAGGITGIAMALNQRRAKCAQKMAQELNVPYARKYNDLYSRALRDSGCAWMRAVKFIETPTPTQIAYIRSIKTKNLWVFEPQLARIVESNYILPMWYKSLIEVPLK